MAGIDPSRDDNITAVKSRPSDSGGKRRDSKPVVTSGKKRARIVKRIVIILIVLVAIFVAVDYGLAAAAEYQVSKKARADFNLANDPAVNIHGFPFMTQAIAGDYSDITINATDVPVNERLTNLEVDADLRHVHVSLSDLLSGNVQQVKIDEIDGQVQINAADLGRLLNIPDLTITPVSLDTIMGIGADQAQQQRIEQQYGQSATQNHNTLAGVELTGTLNVAGQNTQVSAYALISLSNSSITVTPKKLDLTNNAVSGPLADSIEQQLLPHFALTLSTDQLPLPFKVQPTGVQVGSGTLILQGVAQNFVWNSASQSQ